METKKFGILFGIEKSLGNEGHLFRGPGNVVLIHDRFLKENSDKIVREKSVRK